MIDFGRPARRADRRQSTAGDRIAVATAAVIGWLAAAASPGEVRAQSSCAAAQEQAMAVFGSAEATASFMARRETGEPPFEALLGVQRGPAAREALLACRAEITAYLEDLLGPAVEAPAMVADLPRVAPGCVAVRWADDFPVAAPREGAPPTWRVTASVTNNCLKPVLLELCVAFPPGAPERLSRQSHLIDRPIQADYPFAALSSPTNEYSPSYMVCEIDETCDSCPARAD